MGEIPGSRRRKFVADWSTEPGCDDDGALSAEPVPKRAWIYTLGSATLFLITLQFLAVSSCSSTTFRLRTTRGTRVMNPGHTSAPSSAASTTGPRTSCSP